MLLKVPQSKKIAVVTGASSEIGVVIVKDLILKGFYVVAQYNDNRPMLDDKVSQSVYLYKADFLSGKGLANFVTKLEFSLPYIDLIVNCAALHEKHLTSLQDEYSIFQKVSKINTFVPIYIVKKLHKKMLKRENSLIISISSFYAVGKGSLSNIFYATTKTSLLTMSRIFALEYIPIRSNVIIPGYVDTKTYRKGRSNKDIENDKKSSLNKELTSSVSILKTVEFIINNKSINAAEIKVDGGLYI